MSASTKYESIPESVADEWRASPLSILFFSWLYPLLKIFAVKAIVTYAEHKQTRDADGTAWSTRRVLGPARVVDVAVAVMVVCPALQGLCNHWFYHHVMIDGLHARSALKSALFRKLLRVPGVGGGNADASISAKTDGHMSIVGRMKQAQGALMAAADERMRGVKETVQAMLAVKVFGWEASFRASVKQARKTELAHSLRLQTLGAGANAVMEAVPILCALASLGSYGLLYPDRPLTASSSRASRAVARIDDFLGAAECESYVDRSTTDGATVRVVDGAFAWPASLTATPGDATAPFALRIADLGLGKGLNVVVGAVASGKSTLLAALLGELERTSGTVAVRGRVALCPQAPWIFNATLKENVLFGAEYDAARYAALPDGDRSEIGERGITLSGGQKARVSLARALYADADVYLLDDVLSAVDAHVGRHIVDRVLLDLLGDKTVILASHQLSCLDRATTVVVLKGGAVAFAGTPADCYAADALEGIRGERDDATGAASASREIAPTVPAAAAKVDEERKDDATPDAGKLTTAEDRVVGTVSMRVLRSYARLCGIFFVFLVVAFLVLKTAGAVCAQAWVAEWTDATADEADDGADDGLNVRETRYYISGYAVVSFVTVAFVVANQLAAVNASAVASAEVHGLAFDAVVRAPLAYFEVTPPGRILARFGNDINVVDAMLMTSLNASGGQLAVLASIFMADLYRKSSRELKRLENMAETPVYSGFASCMDGLLTIRAFQGASERLVVQTDATIDDWAACWLKNNGANRWMGMRLDAIGAALVGLVALFCVLRVDGLLGMGSSFDAGRVGLMLSFAAAVSGILNCWPTAGRVTLEKVSMRYRPNLPTVLDGISLTIAGGERVGVCGRTGSGKSSLAKCLFRLVDFEGGDVVIDGKSAKATPLATWRSALAMVQQDPQLFSGTLRHNVDPTRRASDDEVKNALATSSLGHLGLDSNVDEGGANLSAGEKQLVQLARVLLCRPKILVLDEATSSLDRRTDEIIQKAVRDIADVTVITIAHRLETLLDYDKVLVLDKGQVAEFGAPGELAAKDGGVFAGLLSQQRRTSV
ncbi:ATPase [Aureococcus anophagefferens]|nr:ATPase [Aureococcus anophagefferens]